MLNPEYRNYLTDFLSQILTDTDVEVMTMRVGYNNNMYLPHFTRAQRLDMLLEELGRINNEPVIRLLRYIVKLLQFKNPELKKPISDDRNPDQLKLVNVYAQIVSMYGNIPDEIWHIEEFFKILKQRLDLYIEIDAFETIARTLNRGKGLAEIVSPQAPLIAIRLALMTWAESHSKLELLASCIGYSL